MGLWGRRNGDRNERGQALLPAPAVIEEGPPPPPEDPDAEFIWRCRSCGSMGTAHESLLAHIAPGRRCEAAEIREYVPRPPASQSTEVGASGIWIVVKLPEDTEEGERPGARRHYDQDRWDADVVEASTGLGAIQSCYREQIERLRGDATEADREKANGRYVAIDFFTGHRAEALVTSEWRANVVVAGGSHE